jgi:hypothetical protein
VGASCDRNWKTAISRLKPRFRNRWPDAWRSSPGNLRINPPGARRWNFLESQRVQQVGVIGGLVKFLLWCILLVLCWPVALLALILYPLVWLLLLPFRILGIAVDGVLELLRAIFLLPVRLLSRPGRARAT